MSSSSPSDPSSPTVNISAPHEGTVSQPSLPPSVEEQRANDPIQPQGPLEQPASREQGVDPGEGPPSQTMTNEEKLEVYLEALKRGLREVEEGLDECTRRCKQHLDSIQNIDGHLGMLEYMKRVTGQSQYESRYEEHIAFWRRCRDSLLHSTQELVEYMRHVESVEQDIIKRMHDFLEMQDRLSNRAY